MEFHLGDRVITSDSVSYRFRNKFATIVGIEYEGRVMVSFDDIDDPHESVGWGAPTSCLKLVESKFEDNEEINKFIDSF